MWVWAYRRCSAMVEINTNNGVESIHNILKTLYIDKPGVRSLTEVVDILTRRYLPDLLRR